MFCCDYVDVVWICNYVDVWIGICFVGVFNVVSEYGDCLGIVDGVDFIDI